MARQVSLIIADMIQNRIESEKAMRAEKVTMNALSPKFVEQLESVKILEQLNEEFEELLNELELCLRRRLKDGT